MKVERLEAIPYALPFIIMLLWRGRGAGNSVARHGRRLGELE